ncbi:unnamed protein product [Arctia plantaginis]|uniref:Lipoprotein n=1 Tax=Arctia plantaginis TaxID=874455 RepID=A0A8S1B4I5_ARCPL|nr:unnamed protein product [Arctia plantaginis]
MTIRNVAPWALTPLLGVGVGCHLCTVTGCGLQVIDRGGGGGASGPAGRGAVCVTDHGGAGGRAPPPSLNAPAGYAPSRG